MESAVEDDSANTVRINCNSDLGINKGDLSKSKTLRFKLKRSHEGESSIMSDAKEEEYTSSPNLTTTLKSNSLCSNNGSLKRRQYRLHPSLVPRSVVLSSLNSSCPNLVTECNSDNLSSNIYNHRHLSLNSTSVKQILANDFRLSVNSEGDGSDSELKKKNGEMSSHGKRSISKTKIRLCSELSELEPVFAGYQLVGDSQLLRFATSILGMERKFTHSPSGSLGLCVSGQRICDLHNRVLSEFYPVGEKIILLIGTNDLLKGTTTSDMCRGLQKLLTSLYQNASKIVILTLPPVPKLAYLANHWAKLKKYNDFIFSLKDHFSEKKYEIADVSPLFYQVTLKKCNLACFELWFDGPQKRQDLIHINRSGFKLIRNYLLKKHCKD